MTTMPIALDGVGRWTPETPFDVELSRVRRYAAAINDDHPLYAAGALAPPLFAVVPIGDHISGALHGLIADEDRRWGLHAAQDMIFHSPILPGTVLRSRAAPIGVHPRPKGTGVVIKTETRLSDGTLLVEQYASLFFRRRFHGPGAGEAAPDQRAPARARSEAHSSGLLVTVTETVDADQTRRYAEASGDHNPIHLDDAFARSVGLPGIIVHGMCTMAFAARAVVAHACAGDPRRLKRLAVRFARPVLPGQTLTIHLWPADLTDGAGRYAFDTLNPDGKAVLQDGLAEVGGPAGSGQAS
jgi:acyl dehydratase